MAARVGCVVPTRTLMVVRPHQGLGQVATSSVPVAQPSSSTPSATPYIIAGAATTIALGLLVYLATR